MSFLKRLFSRKNPTASEFVEDSKPEHAPESDSRRDFYADLEAQQAENTRNMLFGPDQVSEEEARAMVQKIMPRTVADLKVVQTADTTPTEVPEVVVAPTDLAVAQDAAPAGEVQKGLPNSPAQNLLMNVDLYQVYALINPRILKHFVSRAFIGYPACTILAQHEVIGLCCSMPPEDAIAPGFTLTCVSRKHDKEDGDRHIQDETTWLEEMKRVVNEEGVEDLCIKFGTYKRIYGIGIAIPRVELKDNHTFEEPYDPTFIKPGSFKGFTAVDPSRITWDVSAESLFDPMSEWYQKPEFLRLTALTSTRDGLGENRRIHRSWLITSNYREVGEDLLATYMWGGQPLTQLIYERVFCADTLANEIVALASSKRCVVKDGNMKQMIANPKATNQMISRFNGYRNNSSIVFKEPGEQVTQLETSLADLHPLSAQQYQYVAAYSGIPMTKLFKNVPSGLQATGQYEVEDYEETIKPIRKDNAQLITRWLEMYVHSAYPDRTDLSLGVKWNPFVAPKAHEVQQIASSRASMVCQLLQNHAITVTEGRAILKGGENETFSILAAATPPILAKIEELSDPEKQQEMQMKMQQQMQPRGGAGLPGAGAPGNPAFEENKGVFEQALAEVMGTGAEEGQKPQGGEEEKGDETPAAPEGAESPAPAPNAVAPSQAELLPPGE